MAREYLIGVDLGTSATKAALYLPDGTAIAEATVEVPLRYPEPGVVEQDQDDFLSTAAAAVRKVLAASGVAGTNVAAIGCDSQMAGIGAVDRDFRPAIPFDSWLDMRCQPYIDRLDRENGAAITESSGCPPTCAHAAKILWWKHERPEDYRRIARFVAPAGYVAGRLAGIAGEQAFMDYTFLHFSSCSDARRGDWSDDLCDRVGLDREKLSEIVAPWKIIGETAAPVCRDFGLPAGIPIVAGAGDTAASALGAGLVSPGMALDVAGTASVLAACTDRFVADVEHRTLLTMRSIVPGLWHPLAYIGGGGLALAWFRDQFGSQSHIDFDELAAMADAVPPGADGLLFSPHLGGRICPADPGRRGAWQGFSWGHTRAHFFRAILESIAFEYASWLGILEDLAPGFRRVEIRAVGGGARSEVWNRIKADVLAMPYRPLERADIATWGVAMVAGHGVGLIPDISRTAAVAARTTDAGVQPRPDGAAAYAPHVERYIAWQREQDENLP